MRPSTNLNALHTDISRSKQNYCHQTLHQFLVLTPGWLRKFYRGISPTQ